MKELEKYVSQFTKELFPEFYREEGDLFLTFVESYYQWLESENNVMFHTRRLPDYRDIDKVIDDFIIFFKTKYLNDIQFTTASNKQLFVKNALDFYRAKGTERAVDLYFKLIHGIEARVYYPADDLFRLSDNEWVVSQYLEVEESKNLVNAVGQTVRGQRSEATGFVERLVRIKKGTRYISVLYLANVVGDFQTGEQIQSEGLTNNVTTRMVGSLSEFEIIRSDANFEQGENLYIEGGEGKKGLAIVSDVTSYNGVVEFTLESGGYGYSADSSIIGSDKTINAVNFNINNENYFYHTEPLQQFEIIKQDLVRIQYDSASDPNVNLDEFAEDTNVTIYSGPDVVFDGRIVVAEDSITDGSANVVVIYDSNIYPNPTLLGGYEIFSEANTISANVASITDVSAYANVLAISDIFEVNYTFDGNQPLKQGDIIEQYFTYNTALSGGNYSLLHANGVVIDTAYNPITDTYTATIERDTGCFRTNYEQYISEEYTTNLIRYSEQFGSLDLGGVAYWNEFGSYSITSNLFTLFAPDGNNTPDRFTRSISTPTYMYQSTIKEAVEQTLDFSIHVQIPSGAPNDYFAVKVWGADINDCVDVVYATKIDNGGTVAVAPLASGGFKARDALVEFDDRGSTWWRVSIAFTTDASSEINVGFTFNQNRSYIDGNDSITGSYGYIWGAQLTEGSAPAPYMPTKEYQTKQSNPPFTVGGGSAASLQLEEIFYNYVIKSDDLTDTNYWTTGRATISTSTELLPEIGDYHYDEVWELKQNAGETTKGYVTQVINLIDYDDQTTTDDVFKFTVIAKANTKNSLHVRDYFNTGVETFRETAFDLVNGVVLSSDAGHTAEISLHTSGWYKCAVIFTAEIFQEDIRLFVADDGSDTVIDDQGSIFISSPQLDRGIETVEYTPTRDYPVKEIHRTFNIGRAFIRPSDRESFLITNISNVNFGVIDLTNTFYAGNAYGTNTATEFEIFGVYGYTSGNPADFVVSDFSNEITIENAVVNTVINTLGSTVIGTADYGLSGVLGNPGTGYNSFLDQTFNYANLVIGEIREINQTSPGQGYARDPFFIVLEEHMFHRGPEYYDIDIFYNTSSGQGSNFVVDEIISTEDIAPGISGAQARIVYHDRTTKRIKAVRIGSTDKTSSGIEPLDVEFVDGETFQGQESGASAFVVSAQVMRRQPRTGLNANVTSVAYSGSGFITGLTVRSSGFGYEDGEIVRLISFDDETKDLTARLRLGKQGISDGYFKNRKSFLSSDKYLHDNDFYQEYSYKVLTALPFESYKDTLTKVLHVAGSKLFGGYVATTEVPFNIISGASSAQFELKSNYIHISDSAFYSAALTTVAIQGSMFVETDNMSLLHVLYDNVFDGDPAPTDVTSAGLGVPEISFWVDADDFATYTPGHVVSSQ